MPDLLSLTIRAVDLATKPARFALGKVMQLVQSEPEPPVQEKPLTQEPVQSVPHQAAPPRPKKRAPAKRVASPKAVRRAVRHEPTKGEAAAIRQQARQEEQDAGSEGGPGATITVAEPWDGYAEMTEAQVLDRLTGADSATRGAVRLYESFNAKRQQVIYATEEAPAV